MTFRVLSYFTQLKRGSLTTLGALTAVTLTLVSTPALAGDPFRSGTEHDIGPHTEAAFESFFKQGDYISTRASLALALDAESDEPLATAWLLRWLI